jgi:Skp family chaperone for outer membrane proteins
LGSYVEGEQLGFVAILLEQGLGDVDTQRAERRSPIDADAALQARVKAFEAKAQQAEQELARTQENLQSINYNILRQIKEKLDPAVRQVMATKGASVVLEAGSILQFSPALDATNEIVAALNSTLPSISVTPLPQQAKPQSR